MAEWISVYCREQILLDVDEIRRWIEMSAADSTSMGAVLGEIVALELAAAGDGLVWFFGKDWVSPEDRAATVWTSS
ncbi:hypothetical protein [Nocardia seriolae]|nr:hypothetical protein [Nocardia seriolae]APA96109.1 hypothetical protein NS506_02042 [Nocardia seriolae]MTJ65811.1 hypothetical protein [Nocardia seriolae]MTJ73930.1 hypothetical protein [Nocardia seriolae]MTJ86256.1 hypothetical protein [Nocardia seriolae]MTK30251.1 hypothetical protein [Nocardia seriolae]